MMTEHRDDLPQEVERAGLMRASEQYPDQVAKARAAAARMVAGVPRNLPMSEEPAHVFNAARIGRTQ